MCKYKMQMTLKRCKQYVLIFLRGSFLTNNFFPFRSFELGGEKKTKGAALTFVSLLNVLQFSLHAEWLPSTFSEHPMHYARLTFCSSTSPTKYDMHTQFKNLFRPSKLLVNLCPAPPMETLIHISWLSTFYVRIEYELLFQLHGQLPEPGPRLLVIIEIICCWTQHLLSLGGCDNDN